MPPAPASAQSFAFSRFTPPSASTGIFARQALRSSSIPAAWIPEAPLFFEHGSENSQAGSIRRGGIHFLRRMARHRNNRIFRSIERACRQSPRRPRIRSRDIVAPQMHPRNANGQRHIRARINQQKSRTVLRCRVLHNDLQSFTRQRFQIPSAQVLLAQLDIFHSNPRRFRDFLQKPKPPLTLIASKSVPVGDVIQQESFAHLLHCRDSRPKPALSEAEGAVRRAKLDCSRLYPTQFHQG